MNHSIFLLSLLVLISSCREDPKTEKPNVILIMADDMGYECLSCYGSLSYRTPVLDSLAEGGILFSNCVSQPLCTPSRVKIMTGLYNYRNYTTFGHLSRDQYTFGNLFKEAGYTTCIAGKWQLNGINNKEVYKDWDDSSLPGQFGFDEYCLWQLTKSKGEGERYADPLIEQNGSILNANKNSYGPDVFANYITGFIEKNRDNPFFIYYPMVLVHNPFVPTPDSPEWADETRRYETDTAYFRDMVEYADKIVGRITGKLKDLGLDKNTLLIFTGDNGTNVNIYTRTKGGTVHGGKGNTIDAGTHVPLIAYWPQYLKSGMVFEALIEFSDFFPTFADITGLDKPSDGKSFYPLLTGKDYLPRETAFVHYDPQLGQNVNRYRNRFIRTLDYKLYLDGRFFNLNSDRLEKTPLDSVALTQEELKVRNFLQHELNKHPVWIRDAGQ